MSFLSRCIERFRFRHLPRIARWLISLSTLRARRNLARATNVGILVDNTVLGLATTHETAWISTGRKRWGSQLVDTGYAARIPIFSKKSDQRDYLHLKYLAGLISLARNGHVRMYTSAELLEERSRKPPGMFQGYGYYDHNLFSDLKLDVIDGNGRSILSPGLIDFSSLEDQQRNRLVSQEALDPEYASLVKVLGRKNSQDAWHIRTAERHSLLCFLTMDFKLIDALNAQKGSGRIKQLQTKVLTPADLGKLLGVLPISPNIMSYDGASFPVRADLAWADGKRRGRRRRQGD